MKISPFIFIGDANDCFDNELNLLKEEPFKFLMLVVSNELKMLLMIKGKPYNLHAQGLKKYMEDEELKEIIVHGGGCINFDPNINYSNVSIFSYAFKGIDREEVSRFLKSIWPSMEVDTSEAYPIDKEKNKETYHRVYTLEEVIKEASVQV